MASWVITISKDFPQHWDYARQHGVWDMPKRFPVRAGDHVYFRLAGGPLLGQTLATSDARPLAAADEVPWDDGREPYTTRFSFQLLSDLPRRREPWGRTAGQLSKNPVMQVPRSWDSPQDEAVLASYFDEVQLTPQQALDDARREQILADLDQDLRVRRLQLVALRQGQPQFRDGLLKAYDGRCAVTGTAIEAILEAAHISPFRGPQTNFVSNGLLLRADVHTLFDLYLLTVTPQGIIRVSPDLSDPGYLAYDGRGLAQTPTEETDQPGPDSLRVHNGKCVWLRS